MTAGEVRKRKTVSAKTVHKHWQGIMEHGDIDLWTERIGYSAVENILESDGKDCYACGRHASVQICHILPFNAGGNESPENLFLMCYGCHERNPDTLFPEIFWAYVKTTDCWFTQSIKKFEKACDNYQSTLSLADQSLVSQVRYNREAVQHITPILLDELGKCCGARGANTFATKGSLYIKLLLDVARAKGREVMRISEGGTVH